MSTLTGKVALVTGAGRGIGEAVALALSQSGASVALVARSADQLAAVEAGIAASGGRAASIVADITRPGAADDIVAAAEAALGPLDILVNSAGISPSYARAEHLDVDIFDRVIDTNLRAPFLLCQAAGRGMLSRQRGAIVNVVSIGALVGLPRLAAYCAAKGGLASVTRVLAVEWAPRGVRVNAVAPGFVDTEMTHQLLDHPVHGPNLLRQIPMGRTADPTHVAGAVRYLVSDDAGSVTGHTLTVDGGWTAQ